MTDRREKSNSGMKISAEKYRTIPGLHIEADSVIGGMSIIVSGVVAISEFSASAVIVISKRGSVEIDGSLLEVKVFEGGKVEIRGRITDMRFIYSRMRRKINVKT